MTKYQMQARIDDLENLVDDLLKHINASYDALVDQDVAYSARCGAASITLKFAQMRAAARLDTVTL